MLIMRSIIKTIKKNEGSKKNSNGRHILYQCPSGKWTCGYGRNAEDNGFSESEVEGMLYNDIGNAITDLFKIFPNFSEFTYNRTIALTDMMFNLGYNRFKTFKRMIAAIKVSSWDKAAEEAQDSRWFHQVGQRAINNVKLLREE